MLATQERLNYQSANVFQIGGLACTGAVADREALKTASVQLFLARAQHSRSRFALNRENAGQIAAICSKVEGLPLAIELAAAALRDHRCEEIAASLEDGLGMLSSSLLDMPAEHRSMRIALDRPWNRLSKTQQDLITTLMDYSGEITPFESGVSQADLHELVDTCLLEKHGPRCFRMHPLVRLYLREKTNTASPPVFPGRADLPGKHMFWDRLERMIARARRYAQTSALILLSVTGTGGQPHKTSGQDQILLQQIRRCLRKSDTALLLDGDLFGVILEDISRAEDSLQVCEKIDQALRQPAGKDGGRLISGVYVGISIYPRDGQEAGKLVECADSARQQAVEAGVRCRIYGASD